MYSTMNRLSRSTDISDITALAMRYKDDLDGIKRDLAPPDFRWYPYNTLFNFHTLQDLLKGPNRQVLDLIGDYPVVDIGAADGDTAFFLETLGLESHAVDYGPTNANNLRGMRLLRD